MARCIDLGSIANSRFVDSDEFVAEDAAIVHVTAGELQVGIADAGHEDAEDHLAGALDRLGEVAAEGNGGAVARDAAHFVEISEKIAPREPGETAERGKLRLA